MLSKYAAVLIFRWLSITYMYMLWICGIYTGIVCQMVSDCTTFQWGGDIGYGSRLVAIRSAEDN